MASTYAQEVDGNFMIPPLTVVVDSREQTPYTFEKSIVAGLRSGDYSILGLEDQVAIERKSKSDAYGTIGGGRERFERELERLAVMKYAAIVIECGLIDFLCPPEHSALNPKSAIGSLLSWSVKHRLPVFFAGDRVHGNAVTAKLLEKFFKYHNAGEHNGDHLEPHR